jgi:hypothetical protein
MAKKTVKQTKQPDWKEVDPKVVIGGPAGKICEYLYRRSVWTIGRVAATTGLRLEIAKEQLDELVKIGKVTYLEKSVYDEPAYQVNYELTEEENKSAEECRKAVGETAGKIWHCLGQAGETAKGCRLTSDQIHKKIGAKEKYTEMGIGWLAREGKLRMFENATAKGSKRYAFCLTEVEQKIYNGLRK